MNTVRDNGEKPAAGKPKPPSEAEYEKSRVGLALTYAPEISPCRECGWPHLNGYCCNTCGSTSP